ncbi:MULTISPECIES: IucA/IucC family protein [Halomonas]|uniref:IucA/IucC family protein n=1 Tax=Halomonas TaxID=2745 RepID=UPI001C96E134|nr:MULTISPECIES: IucA/IucC family protein [Halomonas]MBY6208612.1 IucA/IucC family siderophore biosynthesis protein [Halomonas sp. DP3Y7-2]MBY6227083.1 IucA/IucC family siderophore biosynthesis protein [Halomonas sp. DP3Y7-1]MCA0915169.1 IucA/IucC family siderophore biosynthesis protein [Halomonas denitrificans]
MQFPLQTRTPGEIARHASQHALLNGIIKEVGIPQDLLSHHWPAHRQGLPHTDKGWPLQIAWSPTLSLFVLVDRHSALGVHAYVSELYLRRPTDPRWRPAQTAELVAALLEDGPWRDAFPNPEFRDQVLLSQRVMEDILSRADQSDRRSERPERHPLGDYASSEQGLWFGHPNHPTPKARQWPEDLPDAGVACSPESGIATRLHQFSFPAEGLRINSNGPSPQELLHQAADQAADSADDRVVLAMHPIQAELFRRSPQVAPYLADGRIRDLGASGFEAVPTASMRTWYLEDHPWFIKGSLNVRITNCVRKNAWYELASTLVIDRIMAQLVEAGDPALKRLEVAREPATLHWTPSDDDADGQDPEVRRWFCEQTGIILRDNFCRRFGAERCLLSATVFARDTQLTPMVLDLVGRSYGVGPADSSDEQRLDWFRAYLKTLVEPVLALYFRHGIVVEPHLQNCVLVHQQGRPQRMLLRDFEGTKLTADLGVDWLAGETLDPRVRQSMVYSREKGWNRIAYCLLLNHLAEAILALSWQRPALADDLWDATADELARVRDRLSEMSQASPGRATPELDALLAGDALPCKTNLKLRLMAQADRHAEYVRLPSPWRAVSSPRREVAHG